MGRLSCADCDPTALLAQLGSYWTQRNEPDLLQLLPHLERLREELVGTARRDDPDPPANDRLRLPAFLIAYATA
jgi:hypothetical protein